jgi:low affinity Fe/Cu permease
MSKKPKDGSGVVSAKSAGAVYRFFEDLAAWTTKWTGSTKAFITAIGSIVFWLVCGPIFGYSDTWQLVINTSTTIITFMMVFLLQRAHNKESLALQIKLNELIASHDGASNRMINIENLTEGEIVEIHRMYDSIAKSIKSEGDMSSRMSIESLARIDK